MSHGYRCPFCQSTRPAHMRRVRSPLGVLIQLLLITAGLPFLAWLALRLSAWTFSIGAVIGLVGGAGLLWYGILIGLDQALRSREQVCPDCKMRLS